jgi:hypothetical protein
MRKPTPTEDYGERRFVGLDRYKPFVFLLPVNDGAVIRMIADTEYMAIRREVGKFNSSNEPIYYISGVGTRMEVARMAPKDQEFFDQQRREREQKLKRDRELVERSRARAARLGKGVRSKKHKRKKRR